MCCQFQQLEIRSTWYLPSPTQTRCYTIYTSYCLLISNTFSTSTLLDLPIITPLIVQKLLIFTNVYKCLQCLYIYKCLQCLMHTLIYIYKCLHCLSWCIFTKYIRKQVCNEIFCNKISSKSDFCKSIKCCGQSFSPVWFAAPQIIFKLQIYSELSTSVGVHCAAFLLPRNQGHCWNSNGKRNQSFNE